MFNADALKTCTLHLDRLLLFVRLLSFFSSLPLEPQFLFAFCSSFPCSFIHSPYFLLITSSEFPNACSTFVSRWLAAFEPFSSFSSSWFLFSAWAFFPTSCSPLHCVPFFNSPPQRLSFFNIFVCFYYFVQIIVTQATTVEKRRKKNYSKEYEDIMGGKVCSNKTLFYLPLCIALFTHHAVAIKSVTSPFATYFEVKNKRIKTVCTEFFTELQCEYFTPISNYFKMLAALCKSYGVLFEQWRRWWWFFSFHSHPQSNFVHAKWIRFNL